MKYHVMLFLLLAMALHADAIAKFEFLSGNVQYRLKGGDWKPAKLGQSLATDSDLETGPRGKATVVFPNGSHLTLNALTRVTFDKYSVGKFGTQSIMSLRTGRVVANIAKYKKSGELNYFLIRTPTAVAGVRGTIEEVAYSPDKGSEIKLVESGAEVLNRAGNKTVVPEGGKSKVTDQSTLTADKVATREASATMVSQQASSEHETGLSYTTGDFNFSANSGDFTGLQQIIDRILQDRFSEIRSNAELLLIEKL